MVQGVIRCIVVYSNYYGFMDNNYRFIIYLLNDRKTC